MLERIGSWVRKHPEAACRIGGGLFAGNGIFWGWLVAKISLETFASDVALPGKIAMAGLDLTMIPVLAVKIADGVSDIITGQHHWLGCKIVDRFDQFRERRNRDLQRTPDPWAGEEAKLLLDQLGLHHHPTWRVR